jgi:hypothetical protein
MKLTTYLGEFSSKLISVTVEYDHKNDVVDDIVSVVAREESKTMTIVSYIDLTELFKKHFESDLEYLIETTEWKRLYQEYKTEKQEHKNEAI